MSRQQRSASAQGGPCGSPRLVSPAPTAHEGQGQCFPGFQETPVPGWPPRRTQPPGTQTRAGKPQAPGGLPLWPQNGQTECRWEGNEGAFRPQGLSLSALLLSAPWGLGPCGGRQPQAQPEPRGPASPGAGQAHGQHPGGSGCRRTQLGRGGGGAPRRLLSGQAGAGPGGSGSVQLPPHPEQWSPAAASSSWPSLAISGVRASGRGCFLLIRREGQRCLLRFPAGYRGAGMASQEARGRQAPQHQGQGPGGGQHEPHFLPQHRLPPRGPGHRAAGMKSEEPGPGELAMAGWPRQAWGRCRSSVGPATQRGYPCPQPGGPQGAGQTPERCLSTKPAPSEQQGHRDPSTGREDQRPRA